MTLTSTWRKFRRCALSLSKSWLRPLFGLGLLAFLLWRVDWQELVRIASQASMGYVGVALLIELLSVIPKVLRWQALLAAQGMRRTFADLLSIYLVGSFFNNFLPSNIGGDSVRMVRMAQLTGRGADSVSSVLVERLCGLFAVLLMGLVAVLSNWQLASAGGIGFLVLGVFVAFALGVLLLFNLGQVRSWSDRLTIPSSLLAQGREKGKEGRTRVPWLAALIGKLSRLYDSLYAFRNRRRVLLVALAFSLLFRFGNALNLYVQSLALHMPIPFIWLIMVLSLVAVVTSVPLSLNAIGIQEGAYIFFFSLAGIAAPQALALALLSRGVRLAVSLVGGVLYLLGR